MPILLISHFHPALVHNILKYTHHEPIFKCLFTLVRISIEEDEWKDSLNLLKQLYQSALIN